MKPTPTHILLLTAALISSSAADVLRMKDGSKIEGKVLSETADEYLMEVQVSRSIKDEKKVKKSDVAALEKETAEDKAFVVIKTYVPTPDLLTLADYDGRVAKVGEFIKANGKGPMIPVAKKIFDELEAERVAVKAGGVKLGGHLITAEERVANKFEIDARMIQVSIAGHAKAGEWIAALREFEPLEKDYSSTLGFREAVPVIKQVIEHYRSDAAEALSTFDARMKERQVGLGRMAPDDRSASTAAIAEQTAAATDKFTAEKKGNIKWVTPDPNLKVSLDEAIKYAVSESKRLDLLKTDGVPDGGKAWRDAWTAVHLGGDPKGAAAALSNARAAKMPASYIAELEAAAKAAGAIK